MSMGLNQTGLPSWRRDPAASASASDSSESCSDFGSIASRKVRIANHSRYAAPPQRRISSAMGAFSTRTPTPAVPAATRTMAERAQTKMTAVMP